MGYDKDYDEIWPFDIMLSSRSPIAPNAEE
jgi:hypothetical protein